MSRNSLASAMVAHTRPKIGPIILGPPTNGEPTLVEVYGVRNGKGFGALLLGVVIFIALGVTKIGGQVAYYGVPIALLLILIGLLTGIKVKSQYIEGNCQQCGSHSDALTEMPNGEYHCERCVAGRTYKQRYNLKMTEPPPAVTPQQTGVVKEVYKEREVIREIVKIRCRHCSRTFNEISDRCPYCGAPA